MHVQNFNRFSFIYHNFNFYACTMAKSGLAVTDEQGYADQYGDVRMPNNVPATAAFYTATDVSCDLVALG